MKIILHKIILVMGLLFPYITNVQAQDYNLLSEQTHYKVALNKASCSGDDGTLAVTINEDIAENYDNYIYELKNADTGAVLSTTGTITNTAHIFTKLEPGVYTTKIKALKIHKIALNVIYPANTRLMVNDEGKENVWIDWDNDGVKDENEGIKEHLTGYLGDTESSFTCKYLLENIFSLCPPEIVNKLNLDGESLDDFKFTIYGNVVGFEYFPGVVEISISKNSKLEYIKHIGFSYNTAKWNLDTQKNLEYLWVDGAYDLDFNKVPLSQLKMFTVYEYSALNQEGVSLLFSGNRTKKISLGDHIFVGAYLDLSMAKKLEKLFIGGATKLEKINLSNGNNPSLQMVYFGKEGDTSYAVPDAHCPLLKCIQLDTGFTPPNEWGKPNDAEWRTDGTACP